MKIFKVNMKLAAAEEAVELSIWTTATICRVLSLENVMFLFYHSIYQIENAVISIIVVLVT